MFISKSKIYLLISLLSVSYISSSQIKSSKTDDLPAPFATKSKMNFSNAVGWKDGEKPMAPAGFTVTKYADGFENPRWMYVTPNGDILVAETNSNHKLYEKIGGPLIGASRANNLSNSADRIALLRDTNKDGIPDMRTVFMTKKNKLNQPFGMVIVGDYLYVANTDAVLRFKYTPGQTAMTDEGEQIAALVSGKFPRHWTRNIIASPDNTKLYVAVGSKTNIGEDGLEEENGRAQIIEMNLDGSGKRIFAYGLRNPVGMGFAPGTKTLWTAVNERDELGDDLVPDYLTSVKEGGFYGWPYSYFGQHVDPRVPEKRPDLVAKAIVPEVPLGSHTASLGLAFCTKKSFPKKYQNGVFIAQHGSWNRTLLSGYRVVFVPFEDGKPAGKPEDFLTGFIITADKKVHGRPVGITEMYDGSMLVTDDICNTIWRVSADAK